MARTRPSRENPAKKRQEGIELIRELVKQCGIAVITVPGASRSNISDIWGRDYSSLAPLDVKFFQALDALVDAGEFNRGPYGLEALAYYSKQGTRLYEAGRS